MMFWDRIKDRVKLLNTLSLAHLEARPVLLWQAPSGKGRITCKAMVIDIDESARELVLTPIENEFRRDFDERDEFYVRFPHRSLLLKARGKMGAHGLILRLPEEIIVQEYRGSPRLNYGVNSEFRSLVRKLDQGRISQDKFQLPLHDVGPGGLSLMLSTQESNLFFLNDTILIYQLGALKFNEPLRARLVYIIKLTQIAKGHSRQYKMGLEFEQKVALELLQTLPYGKW